jgi:hypothetical protein
MKRIIVLMVFLTALLPTARSEEGRRGGFGGPRGGGSFGERGGGRGEGGGESRGWDRGGTSGGGFRRTTGYQGRGGRAPEAPIASHPGAFRRPSTRSDIRGGAGRYNWRTIGGRRYVHTYDHGLHWYGFYAGTNFFWTCAFGDYWWWFDPIGARWDFWWGGYWWWPGPGGAVYVNVNGDYRPSNDSGVQAQPPASIPPPPTATTLPSEGGSWKTPDGRRSVQVTGAQGEAFLYDTTGTNPSFMKSLGQNVEKVRFSGGTGGKPAQILLDRKDGSFDLYSEDGVPAASAAPLAAPAAPPAPTAPTPASPPSGNTSPAASPPAPGSTSR